MNTINQKIILAYLRNNKDFLEQEFGVIKIALFGSYAREEAHPESDIDLLIETKEQNFTNRFLLKEHLESQFNKKVDLCYFKNIRLFIKHHIKDDIIYA
jgi:predicted nucleotidyltransferase